MKMEALSVRDILSTQDIVIPEIQREYVWGNNKQLLEQFIRDITTAGTDINVGFLYSYMPEQAFHLFSDRWTATVYHFSTDPLLFIYKRKEAS